MLSESVSMAEAAMALRLAVRLALGAEVREATRDRDGVATAGDADAVAVGLALGVEVPPRGPPGKTNSSPENSGMVCTGHVMDGTLKLTCGSDTASKRTTSSGLPATVALGHRVKRFVPAASKRPPKDRPTPIADAL